MKRSLLTLVVLALLNLVLRHPTVQQKIAWRLWLFHTKLIVWVVGDMGVLANLEFEQPIDLTDTSHIIIAGCVIRATKTEAISVKRRKNL